MAASVLKSRGIPNVINLAGGYGDWSRQGLPVEREADDTSGVAAPA